MTEDKECPVRFISRPMETTLTGQNKAADADSTTFSIFNTAAISFQKRMRIKHQPRVLTLLCVSLPTPQGSILCPTLIFYSNFQVTFPQRRPRPLDQNAPIQLAVGPDSHCVASLYFLLFISAALKKTLTNGKEFGR